MGFQSELRRLVECVTKKPEQRRFATILKAYLIFRQQIAGNYKIFTFCKIHLFKRLALACVKILA